MANLGVRLIGPVYDVSGVSSNLREFALALSETGVQVQLVDIPNLTPFKVTLDNITKQRLEIMTNTKAGENFVSIHMTWPDKMLFVDDQAKANIVWTFTETSSLPHVCNLILNNNNITEVWVPSEDQLGRFNSINKDKIKKVSFGVDSNRYQPGLEKMSDIREEGNFYFSFLGSLKLSSGFDKVLEAFYREFSEDKNVKLILKAFLGNVTPEKESEIVTNILKNIKRDSSAEVIYVPGNISVEEMRKLYHTGDCFVYPGRSKGWSTSIMKSMAAGIPVITTSAMRKTGFISDSNAIMVKSTDKKVDSIDWLLQNPLYNGSHWNEPDVDDLKKTMRSVYDKSIDTEKITIKARQDALKSDWKRVAMNVLKEIKKYG